MGKNRGFPTKLYFFVPGTKKFTLYILLFNLKVNYSAPLPYDAVWLFKKQKNKQILLGVMQSVDIYSIDRLWW